MHGGRLFIRQSHLNLRLPVASIGRFMCRLQSQWGFKPLVTTTINSTVIPLSKLATNLAMTKVDVHQAYFRNTSYSLEEI